MDDQDYQTELNDWQEDSATNVLQTLLRHMSPTVAKEILERAGTPAKVLGQALLDEEDPAPKPDPAD